MSTCARRLQTMLTEEQHQALARLSARTGKPISALIRKFERSRRAEHVAAAKRLIALNAPVADWPQMEAEIIEGALQDTGALPA